MNLIKTVGNCGLILDTESSGGNAKQFPRATANETRRLTGHFILNRYRVDDEGNVCLSPSLPIDDLPGTIQILAAELESLLEQAKRRFAADRL